MHFIVDATLQTHKIVRSKIRTQNGNNFMAVTAVSVRFRILPIKYNLNPRHVHRILIIDTFLFVGLHWLNFEIKLEIRWNVVKASFRVRWIVF